MQKEIKYGSYTATPDDYTCPDGDLAAMAGLERDYSLRGEDKPRDLMGLPGGLKALCLHKTSTYKHYILKGNGRLYWMTEADSGAKDAGGHVYSGDIYKVEPIGNTLVVLAEDGVYYLLWQDGGYKYLGQQIPEFALSFSLGGDIVYADEFALEERWDDYNGVDNRNAFSEDDKPIYNNLLHGAINKLIAERVTGKGKFCMPFFVRYAVRLYDESLVMHSAPVLMLPLGPTASLNATTHKVAVQSGADTLQYQALQPQVNISDWKDIIASVDIFVSAPIWTYDQTKDVDKVFDANTYTLKSIRRNASSWVVNPGGNGNENTVAIPQHDKTTVEEKIKGCAQYYLLKSIKPDGLKTERTDIIVPDEFLQSLTAREAMSDDYFSHDLLTAKYAYNFNGRMNLAGVTRTLYKGYDPFSDFAYTNSGSDKVTPRVRVEIVRDGKTIVVERSAVQGMGYNAVEWNIDNDGVVWFFYPDPNAIRAWLYIGNTCYTMPLTPHSSLNGAYWYNLDGPSVEAASVPAVTEDRRIEMPSKVYTSEVNNPFFFPLLGVNTIGAGEILGVCAAVKAMSQGQFGEYPMYAFTTEGVWALQTKSDGTWGAVTPVTRDVCIDADSITQMDDAVLFVTHRGIMLISGSTSQCISEVIDGRVGFSLDMMTEKSNALKLLVDGAVRMNKPSTGLELSTFERFREGMRMLYDYRHQRIVVYNGTRDGSSAKVYPYAYVYSLKQHQWSIVASDLVDHINSYPDAVGVTLGNRLAVLSDEIDNVSPTPFVLVTRPLKMDAPDIMKTVRRVIQRGEFLKDHVKQVLFGSRDLMHWHLVASSKDCYLRGYSGTSYKWFRLVVFGSLDEGESLTGCTMEYTTRLENQPR